LGVAGIGVVAGGVYFFLLRGKWDAMIKNGSVVHIEYTLSDDKGTVLDSNKGKEPLIYIHGQGQILPGLEKELSGMKVNDAKKVRLVPESAYGPVDPQAFQEIPRGNIPADVLKVGNTLVAKNDQGLAFPVRIHEVKEKTVVIDFNHPLAGKTLSFDVKILEVESPKVAEGSADRLPTKKK